MLPLVRPALVIVTIYNVIPIWNDFFFPLVFIKSNHLKTLAALPVIVLYVVLSQHFIRGLTAGAIKG